MTKYMIVEVPEDFVLGGKMRFKAVDTKRMRQAIELDNDLTRAISKSYPKRVKIYVVED